MESTKLTFLFLFLFLAERREEVTRNDCSCYLVTQLPVIGIYMYSTWQPSAVDSQSQPSARAVNNPRSSHSSRHSSIQFFQHSHPSPSTCHHPIMYNQFSRWTFVSPSLRSCHRLHPTRPLKPRFKYKPKSQGFATGNWLANYAVPTPTTSTAAVNAHRVTRGVNKRLHIGNAVTMFYSTIFAAALILDIQYKEARAFRVKEQLETAEMELLELQIEETRLLEGLRERRRRRWWGIEDNAFMVGKGQRRAFSTNTNTNNTSTWTPRRTMGRRAMSTPGAANIASDKHQPHAMSSDSFPPKNGEPATENHYESITDVLDPDLDINITNQPPDTDHLSGQQDYATDNPLREAAVRRLAVRQLAIKLILRPRIAHSYGSAALQNDQETQELRNMRTSELLAELDEVKKQIMLLKYSHRPPSGCVLRDFTISEQHALKKERARLEDEMRELFVKFEKGQMFTMELLLSLAQNLLSSQEPLSPAGIELLITKFTRAKQNDLAKMVIDALLPNRFPITLPITVATITFYAKTRDLFGFDGLMLFLQGLSGPINSAYTWKSLRVASTDVPAPVNPRHRYVMNALISASLSFDQPHRASAYLSLLRETGYIEGPEVIGSYLRYHSLTPNWEHGRHFLLRALSYIMSTTAHSPTSTAVERLVLYMAIFCNCCGRHDLAMVIVRGATAYGLDLVRCYNPRDVRLAVRLAVRQWEEAVAVNTAVVDREDGFGERCVAFAMHVEPTLRENVHGMELLTEEQEEAVTAAMDDRAFRVRYAGHVFENLVRKKMQGEAPLEPKKNSAPATPELEVQIVQSRRQIYEKKKEKRAAAKNGMTIDETQSTPRTQPAQSWKDYAEIKKALGTP